MKTQHHDYPAANNQTEGPPFFFRQPAPENAEPLQAPGQAQSQTSFKTNILSIAFRYTGTDLLRLTAATPVKQPNLIFKQVTGRFKRSASPWLNLTKRLMTFISAYW